MALSGRAVTVIGAGIGGLALAIALARRGAAVRVVEQAPQIAEVGAGIQVSPNGGVVLRALGLAPESVAVPSRAVVLRDAAARRVARLDLAGRGLFALVHRADLIDLLARGAEDAGVAIETGRPVTEVAPDAGRLCFADGAEEGAEIVLGADGLHSRVRAALLGARAPSFTGQVAWRATVPSDPGELPPEAQVFMAPGRHLVAYPLRGGRLLNLVGVEERAQWVDEGWRFEGDPDAWRRAFAGLGGPVPGWLSRVQRAWLWGLFRHEVAPVWHRGRTAMIGDAAHPTLPFLAQGACLALEDAWVFAAALDRHDTPEAAFAAATRDRLPRVRRIVDAATANARNYHLRGPARLAAHAALRALDRVAPGALVARFDWLYGHDVTARWPSGPGDFALASPGRPC